MLPTPLIHPLVRHGTQQRERLLRALIPASLKLDDRSIADLLAFTGQLAEQVRYWPDSNQLTTPEENWQLFWNTDTTPLLAVVAATDLVDIRTRYRTTELAFLAAEDAARTGTVDPKAATPKSLLANLVGMIFAEAKLVLDRCTELPATNPLKIEFTRLVASKLQGPFRQLIQYHKGVSTKTDDLLALHLPFIGPEIQQQAWGLASADDFLSIPYQQPNATDREPLWRLFLAFYQVLARIVARAEQAFQRALQGRTDHPPHIALMLAFLHLFRYLQAEMNGLPEKHLLYYYQDVLQLQQRQVIPDRVHLVFELAQNLESYRLQNQTALRGGKDPAGIERIYALTDEVVLSQAKLVEKQSLYFLKNSPITPIYQAANANGLSAQADYLALKEKIAKFDAPQLRNRKNAVADDTTAKALALWNGAKDALEARPGLLICSPELWMEKSEGRAISIRFLSDELIDLSDDLKNAFFGTNPDTKTVKLDVLVSAGAEQKKIDNLSVNETDLFDDQSDLKTVAALGQAEPIAQLTTFTRQVSEGETVPIGQELRIFLPPSFPALTPYTGKDNPLLAELPYPFIVVQPGDASDYGAFRNLKISDITLQTASKGVKNITIQLGDVVYSPTAEISLIGATAQDTVSQLYITTPEISLKQIGLTDIDFVVDPINTRPATPGAVAEVDNKSIFGDTRVLTPAADARHGNETVPNFRVPFVQPLRYEVTTNRTFLAKTVTVKAPVAPAPINSYKISPESITIDYQSAGVNIRADKQAFSSQNGPWPHQFFHYFPGGGIAGIDLDKDPTFPLIPPFSLPQFDKLIGPAVADDELPLADGNLMLGFEKLLPDQTLSVLFRTAAGSGDPEKTAPAIIWSYRRRNDDLTEEWVRLPQQFILSDETEGLGKTGIIRFQIPPDITTNNTHPVGKDSRRDLWWLQASAVEDLANNVAIAALPMLQDIVAQAATAQFMPKPTNTLDKVEATLPAQSIAQLDLRDTNVRKVSQPYPSFGGRLPEAQDHLAYYRRISERLRHRQRAVTVWDYEHLTLEAFPGVAVVKCLPHTETDDIVAPGFVTVVLIPDPTPLVGDLRFYPTLDSGHLTDVADWLGQRTDFFVSGQGSFVACCCHNDANKKSATGAETELCSCPPPNRLRVINARFEPIRLQVCVRFRRGKDPVLYRKQLNEALKQFLSPWTGDSAQPIAFGTTIQTTELLRFLENLDYVDVVLGLKVKQLPSRKTDEATLPWTVADDLQPLTPRSVLTSYLDPINADNPNVIDHEINVLTGDDPCHCSSCVDELVTTFIQQQVKILKGQFRADALKKYLDTLVDQGNLVGIKPALIAPDNTSTDTADALHNDFKGAAYWFDFAPVPDPDTIDVAVAAYANAPFVKQTVSKTLTA